MNKFLHSFHSWYYCSLNQRISWRFVNEESGCHLNDTHTTRSPNSELWSVTKPRVKVYISRTGRHSDEQTSCYWSLTFIPFLPSASWMWSRESNYHFLNMKSLIWLQDVSFDIESLSANIYEPFVCLFFMCFGLVS